MELRYPKARQNVSGKMTTQGDYPRGYPQGAIVHFTAGAPNPESTVEGGIGNHYTFFVIGPKGDVYQNFDLNRWGYHAGESSHPVLGKSVSKYLVGIEICNAGKVRQIDDKTFRPWFNDPLHYQQAHEPIPHGVPNPARDLPLDQVRYVERLQNREAGWYHRYTPEQEQALIELLLWLKSNGPGIFNFEFVLGHDEVSPGRKNDPGGALSLTMPDFRAHLAALASGTAPASAPAAQELAATTTTAAAAAAPEPPRLRHSPKAFLPAALAFQKAANLYPGIHLDEDGYAGDKSSDTFFMLTGYYLKGDKRAMDQPVLPTAVAAAAAAAPADTPTTKPKPLTAAAETRRMKIATQIVKWEGRYNSKGELQVYNLPANDGGGRYEVAGLNEKYNPDVVNKLVALVGARKFAEAEALAAASIAKDTDRIASYVKNAGLEAYLRDTAFNRGHGGAVKVLQLALNPKVKADGGFGPITQGLLATAETKPVELLQALRVARESYERNYIGYRENFWKGLVNRWDKALVFALEMLRTSEAKDAATEARLTMSDATGTGTSTTAAATPEEAAAAADAAAQAPRPPAEPGPATQPPLSYAPTRYSVIAERFQQFANAVAGLKLEADGMAGQKTSDAFHLITGYFLAGDPRLEQPSAA